MCLTYSYFSTFKIRSIQNGRSKHTVIRLLCTIVYIPSRERIVRSVARISLSLSHIRRKTKCMHDLASLVILKLNLSQHIRSIWKLYTLFKWLTEIWNHKSKLSMFSHFLHPEFSSHLKMTIRGFLSRSLRHYVVIQFTMADSSYQLLNSSYQNLLLVLFRGGFCWRSILWYLITHRPAYWERNIVEF